VSTRFVVAGRAKYHRGEHGASAGNEGTSLGHAKGGASRAIANGDGRVLRVFRFRPVRPAFDAIVREVMVPDLQRLDGIEATVVGRRGPGELGERVIATVWRTRDAMEAGVGSSFDSPVFHPEYLGETEARRLDVASIAFCWSPGSAAEVGVVRLVVGRAQAAKREQYVEEARAGTQTDLDAGRGPLALYLGTLDEDRFATLSMWSEWSMVGEATGGSLTHPEATRHDELLIDWEVDHYEVVPGVVTPPRPAR